MMDDLRALPDDGFLLFDKQGLITQANPAAAAFFGMDSETIIGENLTDLLAAIDGDAMARRHFEKVRRDFVANVSHELRSPLTSLVGFIETMLNNDSLDDGVRRRFLSIMDEESQRMSRLVDRLLSLSKVEAEEHIAPIDVIFIDSIASAAIASIANRAAQLGRTIVFDNRISNRGGLRPVQILGDTDEMMEVFHNLFDNALKHGALKHGALKHSKGNVRLVMQLVDDGFVEFQVINHGAAIAEKHLNRLTERFYRIDKSRSAKSGGTGLGLAIVKHIVNRHRGVLSMTSKNGEIIASVRLPLYEKNR